MTKIQALHRTPLCWSLICIPAVRCRFGHFATIWAMGFSERAVLITQVAAAILHSRVSSPILSLMVACARSAPTAWLGIGNIKK